MLGETNFVRRDQFIVLRADGKNKQGSIGRDNKNNNFEFKGR